MDLPHNEEWLKHRQFGIVIDAGSSGSRIHIYSWLDKTYINQVLSQHETIGRLPTIEPGVQSGSEHSGEWTKKTEPGIADFKDRPEDVGEHLESLLDHALKIIPADLIPNTPIYLLATAGLRLVQDDIRQQILANSCSYIKDNYKFKIGECKDHIRNISGQEEGIYGWVAINYLMGGFDNGGVKMVTSAAVPGTGSNNSNQNESELVLSNEGDNSNSTSNSHSKDDDNSGSDNDLSGTHGHTLGFLDMGGASTQIAFEPSSKASADHANDLMKVNLNTLDGKTLEYNVFVTTFLGYGSNEARRRYVKDFLLSNNKDILESENPGVQIQIEDPCLPRNLKLSETHITPHVPLTGAGSFSECLKRVEKLLNKDVECHDEPCLFNGVHTPPIDFNVNTFIGVSEYWYSSNDILGLGGAYDYAAFERKSAEFCNSEWEDIRDRPQYQGQSQDRLEMQCFKSAWLSNVLHGGFGLPRYGEKGAIGSEEQSSQVLDMAEESIKNKNWRPPFQSINAIKDIQVTWTLGAMLLISSGSLGPAETPDGRHRPSGPPPPLHSSSSVPPPGQRPPHEETYPERMLDSYNHFMLLAIVVFAVVVFFGYRSRYFKPSSFVRRWSFNGSFGSGGSGSGFFSRIRWFNGGSSSTDYSSLESGSGGFFNRNSFSPKSSLKELYLSVVHHSRSIWWSLTSRIWPEPNNNNFDASGRPEEMIESITINGFDGNSTNLPMASVGIGMGGNGGVGGIGVGGGGSGGGGHHGGTPAGSFGSSGLSAIPEGNIGGPAGIIVDGGGNSGGGFNRSQHSHSRPPKTSPKFFRINKKRFSGDSQSLFKDGRGFPADGCVVNTALLQKAPTTSVELTARSGSTTNLSGMWSGGVGSGSSSAVTTPMSSSLNNDLSSAAAWKQEWIEGDTDNAPPIPPLLTTSRSFNSSVGGGAGGVGGHSPMMTPLARYKQQQSEGSNSAPSSAVNLGAHLHQYQANNNSRTSSITGGAAGTGTGTGSGSGFVTSADEREEWSGEGDGDDEGDGYVVERSTYSRYHLHQVPSSNNNYNNSNNNSNNFNINNNHNNNNNNNNNNYNNNNNNNIIKHQQQHSNIPHTRSASAVPFSSNSHRIHHNSSMSVSSTTNSSSGASRGYKQRSTGLLSGTNFEFGGGTMTSLDSMDTSNNEGSGVGVGGGTGGSFSSTGRQRLTNIQTTGLLPPVAPGGGGGVASGSGSGNGSGIGSGNLMGMGSTRSASPNMVFQQQQHSTSTSSLVLGRHNVSEADQQIVSRGSSENMRRGSTGALMSP
ncbi:Golgi apyrase [Podila humilis]|nr:Golgi apyrase [Podila humilis]